MRGAYLKLQCFLFCRVGDFLYLRDVIDAFLEYMRCEKGASACTVRAYGSDLRALCDFLSPDARLHPTLVTLADLRAWLGDMGRRGLAPRTLRRRALAARAFFHYLLVRGIITTSPAQDIILPRLPRPLPKLIKEEEIEAITAPEAFETDSWTALRDALIMDMLYSTGLRRSELLALTDDDVRVGEGVLLVAHGKGGKSRRIPLAPQLCRRIQLYRAARDAEFPAPEDNAFLRGQRGRALNNKALSNIIKVQLSSTSAPRKTAHALRHTFATAMLRGGADLNSVKMLLGHASLATTQIYTHLSFSELQHNYQLAHPRAKKDPSHGSKNQSHPF